MRGLNMRSKLAVKCMSVHTLCESGVCPHIQSPASTLAAFSWKCMLVRLCLRFLCIGYVACMPASEP